MWQTWRDRLRIPWQGGAKQVSREAVLPAIILPIIFCIAALNQYVAGVITFFVAIILLFAHYRAQQQQLRTRFFCMWLLWSLVYMVLLFEITVPLLEVLPEENLILVVLCLISMFLLYRTRTRASLNHVQQKTVGPNVEELPNITEEDEAPLTANYGEDAEAQKQQEQLQNSCNTCHKFVPARTSHCYVCGVCVLRHDHHSYWLDCCIGQANHCCYFLGMLFAASALLLAANLILTAVCHPLLVKRVFGVPLMLPDDCSQVFLNEYEFSLSFMLAVYAIAMALYIKAAIVQQIYLVSIGLTLNERRHGQERNHRSIWTNWKNLLLG